MYKTKTTYTDKKKIIKMSRKIFLDCGAWKGNSVSKFIEIFEDADKYKIYCFEPDPNCIKILNQIQDFRLYDIEVINAACWISDCQKTLRVGRSSESNSLVKTKTIKGYQKSNNILVDCIDLPKLIREKFDIGDYIVLKMNIEGAEYEILDKMISDGSIYYIDELYVDFHYGKIKNFDNAKHYQIIDKLERLGLYPKKWSLDHKKKVVYSVITGKDSVYQLNEPKIVTPGWDYICFTDKKINSDIWEIVKIQKYSISPQKMSRKIKILSTTFLSEYDFSLYIDSRFTIQCNLDKFLKSSDAKNNDIVVMRHNKRKCAYKEALKLKIYTSKQINRYAKENFPNNFGLFAPGIMIRNHKSKNLSNMLRCWWNEVLLGSHRDQISLAYSIWKHPKIKINLLDFNKTYTKFMAR